MKIKDITLTNFAKYTNVEVSFDNNITYLVGPNGAGKSTLGLTSIWFMFAGIAERSKTALIGERFRFIGEAGKTATGIMTLYDEKLDAEIKVIRKLTKDTSFLSFEAPEGMELSQQWLNDLFNVFLINPMKFAAMSPKEQALALGIDTEAYDERIAAAEEEAKERRAAMKAFGEPEPVDKPEEGEAVESAEHRRAEYIAKQGKIMEDWMEQMRIVREANTASVLAAQEKTQTADKIAELKSELARLEARFKELPDQPEHIEEPEKPDTAANLAQYDEDVKNAREREAALEKYKGYLTSVEKKAKHEAMAKEAEAKVKEARDAKLAYLKTADLPFKEMTIDDDGGLLVKGKPLREPYFSSGELLKTIPVIQAAKNPDLKYVYIQNFNLLDAENQQKIEDHLTAKGFQLVIEYVGTGAVAGKHCIMLRDNQVISDSSESKSELI